MKIVKKQFDSPPLKNDCTNDVFVQSFFSGAYAKNNAGYAGVDKKSLDIRKLVYVNSSYCFKVF